MAEFLKTIAISVIGSLIKNLKPEQLEKIADKALDWAEEAIKHSKSDVDDKLVLPLVSIVREAFDVK